MYLSKFKCFDFFTFGDFFCSQLWLRGSFFSKRKRGWKYNFRKHETSNWQTDECDVLSDQTYLKVHLVELVSCEWVRTLGTSAIAPKMKTWACIVEALIFLICCRLFCFFTSQSPHLRKSFKITVTSFVCSEYGTSVLRVASAMQTLGFQFRCSWKVQNETLLQK